MIVQTLLAEAERLEAEAERLTAKATIKAREAGKLLDPRDSLLTCGAARALSYRARELRNEAAEHTSPTHEFNSATSTGPIMTAAAPEVRYSEAEVQAAIAAAVAGIGAGPTPAARNPPARPEMPEQVAAAAAAARETEIDAHVARILGDPGYVARSAEQRKARAVEEAADRQSLARSAALDAEAAEIAARIIEA